MEKGSIMEEVLTIIQHEGKITRIYLGNSEQLKTVGELADYINSLPRDNKLTGEFLSGGEEFPDIISLKHGVN